MKIETRLRGLDGILDTLKRLPPEVVSKRGGPVKLALAKGARLIRDQALSNLRASISPGSEDSTGLLAKNVIATRGKPPFGGKGERYLVRVRRKVYARKGKETVSTRKTAALKEYGSSQQPATPWLRPAVRQKGQQAVNVITADLKRRVEQTVKKLAAQNKGR